MIVDAAPQEIRRNTRRAALDAGWHREPLEFCQISASFNGRLPASLQHIKGCLCFARKLPNIFGITLFLPPEKLAQIFTFALNSTSPYLLVHHPDSTRSQNSNDLS